jgi:alkanesulfonate monooxygenase SsuD/methylene tetrahydromethanopterin reductase-like flavin-dependent oxidoreductase (luciferase family)
MSKVKFGVCLPIFTVANPSGYTVNAKDLKTMVTSSEELGYDSLWVCDHLTMGREGYNLEAWTVLSAASQLCASMRLGTLVLSASHRPPALLAKMAATLDVLSNGRMELGLGAGWRRSEQESYGLAWEPSARDRIRRLVETVEIVKGMWTNQAFSYSGRFYMVKDAICNPKPLQKHPKLWLAGRGEGLMLKAIAKYADAWNIDEVTPQEYARKLGVLRTYCNSTGTDFSHIEKSIENNLLITDNKEDLTKVLDWSNYASEVMSGPGEYKPMNRLDEIKSSCILGSVREVTEKVAEYIEAGVQHFMFYFLDHPSLESMKALAKDVIPSL